MTVIAWDGTTLAVDSQMTTVNRRTFTDKLFKHKDEVLAITGNLDVCAALVAWYKGGNVESFPPMNEDNKSYLVVARKGEVEYYGETPYPVKINDRFFALGSGADFAISAMHCGKSAVEAVEIACLYDIHCGGKVCFHSFIGPVTDKVAKKK
jgi:hypothetical protein